MITDRRVTVYGVCLTTKHGKFGYVEGERFFFQDGTFFDVREAASLPKTWTYVSENYIEFEGTYDANAKPFVPDEYLSEDDFFTVVREGKEIILPLRWTHKEQGLKIYASKNYILEGDMLWFDDYSVGLTKANNSEVLHLPNGQTVYLAIVLL